MPNLCKKIRFARRTANISQQELATAMGVTRTTISLWETETARSVKKPHPANLEKVARVTGFPIEWFHDDQPPTMPGGTEVIKNADETTVTKSESNAAGLPEIYASVVRSVSELSPQGAADTVLTSTIQTLITYRNALENAPRF